MSVAASPSSARPLRRFLLLAVGLYLVWFFGYEQWLRQDNRLDTFLSINIAKVSTAALQLLGFPASLAADNPQLLMMEQKMAVFVGNPCNGLVLYVLFAGFVLAYPGPVQRKLWFIPAGILAIYALNVVRVGALALNHFYAHQSVDFNHHYTFTFVVYGCIFLLWMLWARRLSVSTAPVLG
ncbi:exosortase X [Hymenobacter psychrotolerans]|uniref:Exosortase family protein XrtF n=1 Tax=Hymenobacter psychrotolerans DSM 18569 TaxID=1121959 RepID=A0A1M6ZAA3_9BACT|nr:exosortase family protein XrtF [Hymenobacter psychrotolerans]SHL27313.1 exosortase family protein XrtF [Hymenobacter psychrotolerans DSM 18569]